MKHRVVSAAAFSVLILPILSACQNKAEANAPSAEIKAIAHVEGAMRAAYFERDAAKIAALYESHASTYMPGQASPRAGTQAIFEGARKDLADPAFRITFTTDKLGAFTASDAGYSKGRFTIHYTDARTKAPASRAGHYLRLFDKQADGSWKIVEDMTTPTA